MRLGEKKAPASSWNEKNEEKAKNFSLSWRPMGSGG